MKVYGRTRRAVLPLVGGAAVYAIVLLGLWFAEQAVFGATNLTTPGGSGGWVLAVEDTTHVAREQKLAAWSEMARRD